MADQRRWSLRHLPARGQNLFYILILIASPILNLFVNALVYADFRIISARGHYSFGLSNWFFALSGFLLGCVLILLGINLAHVLLASHPRHARRSLCAFGMVSSLYLLINLLTISYGIFAFKVQSLFLLLVSICIYLSLNSVFVFWYWFVDYPSQLRRRHHPETIPQICFPSNAPPASERLPDFFDYLYFSILISNTLGPPENHSPAGQTSRFLVMLHSMVMLVVLVIFVSRAINTLS